jgi:hypothetical protein
VISAPPTDPSGLLLWVLSVGLLALKGYALVDCARRPAGPFVAYGKLSKPAWLAITGVAALLQLVFGGVIGLLSLAGTVAAIVYVVDVKPAVSGTANPW